MSPPDRHMKTSELGAELTKFGVTRQEADLFVLLTRVRNAGPEGVTGNELARLAALNRVRTYQLLDGLVDLGIVQVEFVRPKKYAAESPQTAVRRLVALQESRLTELSREEEKIAEVLAQASPITVQREQREKEAGSRVSVLHGLSTIQGLLRRVMEDRDLRILVNDESEGHVFTTIRYMRRKPKSVRVVFSTTDEKRQPFEGGSVEIDGYRYTIRVVKGDLPTLILNGEQSIMLFFESQKYRPKPLAAMTVRTVVNSCVLVEGGREVRRMDTMYENLWKTAE